LQQLNYFQEFFWQKRSEFYFCALNQLIMGKGDKRSRKGKLIMGSKGKTRPARKQNKLARAEAIKPKKA